MTHEELMKIAETICAAEKIIQTSTNEEEVKKAKDTIVEHTAKVRDLEDLFKLEAIMEDLLK